MVYVMDSNQARLALVIKASASCHFVGLLCNWLMVSILIAAMCMAIFKGKVVGAVLLVVLAWVIRFLIMSLLKYYLARKYR